MKAMSTVNESDLFLLRYLVANQYKYLLDGANWPIHSPSRQLSFKLVGVDNHVQGCALHSQELKSIGR